MIRCSMRKACIPNRVLLVFDLQVFTNILKHKVISCAAEDLSALQERCRDPAVSVRKQALQSVTELLVVRKISISSRAELS